MNKKPNILLVTAGTKGDIIKLIREYYFNEKATIEKFTNNIEIYKIMINNKMLPNVLVKKKRNRYRFERV